MTDRGPPALRVDRDHCPAAGEELGLHLKKGQVKDNPELIFLGLLLGASDVGFQVCWGPNCGGDVVAVDLPPQ